MRKINLPREFAIKGTLCCERTNSNYRFLYHDRGNANASCARTKRPAVGLHQSTFFLDFAAALTGRSNKVAGRIFRSEWRPKSGVTRKNSVKRIQRPLPAQRIDSGTEPPAPAAGSFKNHRVRPAATHSRSLRLEIVTVPVIPGT